MVRKGESSQKTTASAITRMLSQNFTPALHHYPQNQSIYPYRGATVGSTELVCRTNSIRFEAWYVPWCYVPRVLSLEMEFLKYDCEVLRNKSEGGRTLMLCVVLESVPSMRSNPESLPS